MHRIRALVAGSFARRRGSETIEERISTSRDPLRSISRRSRFVGRPIPCSRRGAGACRFTTGAGGLWSMKHVAAIGGPTRLSTSCTTSSTRERSTKASTRSPGLTCVEAFAGDELQPAYDVGRRAAEILLDRIEDIAPPSDSVSVRLHANLKVGESSARPGKAVVGK